MLFISGGGTFLVLLDGKTGWSWVDGLAHQLHHVDWNGFVFYDFIFPLFLFIAGVSLSFYRPPNRGGAREDLHASREVYEFSLKDDRPE